MKLLRVFAFLLAIGAAFGGGYVYRAIKSGSAESAPKNARRVLYWVDPMHPAYKSDKPGIAPDCGMKLEPVYADSTVPRAASAASMPAVSPAGVPPGAIQIPPEKQQLIGVKYGLVEAEGGTRTIHAAGKVAIDEARIQHVHTRVEGWIDTVFADFTGKLVKKGEPLLTIYSPEMLATERELLLAAKAKDLMRNNPMPAAYDQSGAMVEAARRRLELWDLSPDQIDQVIQSRQPIKNITVFSPATGYVIDRKAFPQLKVTPETDLYTIVDLSRVWIMADVFEYEAPNVHADETARVSFQALPGRTFTAHVNYIQPGVDAVTRTLKVRLDMDNPGSALKPDMYADVEFHVSLPARLTVPAEAVLDSGEHKTVFVDRGAGYFEPRQVSTGERAGDRVQILSGLREGERVVTSGSFLIDSESQLRAAAAGMGSHDQQHH
jgi:membrane fusion protein, copper/silver efflux system